MLTVFVLLCAVVAISCILEHGQNYKNGISLLIITIAFTPISFFIFSSCFPYKTERIDTYNVLLEQEDNEYIVMCENEYVKMRQLRFCFLMRILIVSIILLDKRI